MPIHTMMPATRHTHHLAASRLQVVIGTGDPNPLVGGEGIKTLERAGIEVETIGGEEEQTAYNLNEEFMERMKAAGQKT